MYGIMQDGRVVFTSNNPHNVVRLAGGSKTLRGTVVISHIAGVWRPWTPPVAIPSL